MASSPTILPPTTVPVLDGNNALTLPWRRALQGIGEAASGGSGGGGSSGGGSGSGSATTTPVVLGFQRAVSAVIPSDVLASWQISMAYTLKAGLSGSDVSLIGATAAPPGAPTVFTVQIGAVTVGSVTFDPGATSGVFAMASDQVVTANTLVQILAPSSLNGMAGYLTGSLAGVR